MAHDIQITSISEKDLEQCLKCSICTAYCPVSGVTSRYPGPKHAGPDGERYRIKDARFYDEKALKLCLNCKRCEVVCPHGVQIGDIIQSARIRYGHQLVRPRDFILANTDLVGRMATLTAPVTNFMIQAAPVKAFMHNFMGIDQKRTFPTYARQTFTSWYRHQAEAQQATFSRQVSYFHGCYVNYNFPQLGQDLIRVMNAIGYGVQLLDKEECCGIALITNGMSGQARHQALVNLAAMQRSVNQGRQILSTSSTCTFTMREEYHNLLGLDNQVATDNLSLATRFICQLIDTGKVRLAFRPDYHARIAYHTACHMERLGWAIYSTRLLRMIPGVDFVMLDSQCCGIGGTYGFKRENFGISQRIGASLFQQIQDVHPDFVATDCETCKWQIEMSAHFSVQNPISVLAQALDLEATARLNQK